MRVFFIGSQEFGAEALKELLRQKTEIVGICALEPGPHETWKDEVSEVGGAYGLSVRVLKDHLMAEKDVENINAPANVGMIKAAKPDLILVFGWRQIIGSAIRSIPKKGVIGIHYSLLPKFRGHAPVSWSIIEGEEEAGLSLFYLEKGTDTGDIITQKRTKISEADTVATVRKRLNALAIEALREMLPLLKEGKAPRKKQDGTKASISAYRLPEHGRIDWKKKSRDIYNEVRATTRPYSGAYAFYEGKKVVVWTARLLPPTPKYVGKPGQIILVDKEEGVVVKTGDHALLLVEIEPEGEGGMPAQKYLKNTRKSLE